MNAAYRVTVYAIASGSAETTPMTPISGSHSDAFKIATMNGVSGFQPYLNPPTGNFGETTLPSCKVTVGSIIFTVLDKRLTEGGSNYVRWASSFLADADKRLRLMGRKVLIEESIDGGATWSLYFVGRISAVDTIGALQYQFTVNDSVNDLTRTIFTDKFYPSLEYCNPVVLHPYGFSSSVFNFPAVIPIRGTVTSVDPLSGYLNISVDDVFNQGSTVPVGSPAGVYGSGSNQLSNQFLSEVPTNAQHFIPSFYSIVGNLGLPTSYTTDTWTTGNKVVLGTSPTSTLGSMWLNNWSKDTYSKDGNSYLSSIVCVAGNSGSADYVPLTSFTLGEKVYFYILGITARYYLGPTSPLQVVKDILDGHYFDTAGSHGELIKIPYDSSLDALIGDTTGQIPQALFYIDKSMTIVDFLEKHVCQPYSIAYGTVPAMNGSSPESQLRFFKTVLPLTIPSANISDVNDVVADNQVQWTAGVPLSKINFTMYEDQYNPVSSQGSSNSNNALITTPIVWAFMNSDVYLPQATLDVDGLGVREGQDLAYTADSFTSSFAYGNPAKQAGYLNRRWGFGSPTITVTCRRTSPIVASQIGDWMLVDMSKMPNQATNLRGGVRLMQVTQKAPQGATIRMKFVDGALNSSSVAPTVGSLQLLSGSLIPVVQLPVSSSIPALISYEVLVCPIGEGTPNATDTRWTPADSQRVTSTTLMNYLSAQLGVRVYGRARSEGYLSGDLVLPSSWVQASNYIDTAYLNPPSGLALDKITTHSVRGSWLTGSNTALVEVMMSSPNYPTGSFTRKALLPAGTGQYIATGLELDAFPSHSYGVRHRDTFGNISPMISASFVAKDPPPVLNPPTLIDIFIGT